jgi:tRNA1Val (adenine37-N6)-methyltransferase
MGRNAFFNFKTFGVQFTKKVFPVGTDSALLGAWMCNTFNSIKDIPTALDIGCGTGILSLFAAKTLNAHVTAIDIQQTAVNQCFENAKSNTLDHRISPTLCDINAFEPETAFDIIVCNPPYFPDIKMVNTEREIARQTGEHFTVDILMEKASAILNSEGSLYLVIPFDQVENYKFTGAKHGLLLHHFALIKGTHKAEIKRALLCFSTTEPRYIKSEIIVLEMERNKYELKAHKLLKPYYLNL